MTDQLNIIFDNFRKWLLGYMVLFHLPICLIVTGQDMTMEEMVNHIGIPSPSSRSPTRPVQQHDEVGGLLQVLQAPI